MHGLARVQGLKVFYSDHFVLPLPEGHRFPMVKYSMLRERVATSAAAVSIFPRVTFLEKVNPRKGQMPNFEEHYTRSSEKTSTSTSSGE